MNNETKLTAADLAMYLGCEVEWAGDTGYTLAGINTGQSDFSPVGIIDTAGNPIWILPEDVKPIIRPLSDMTEDEEKEFVPLCAGSQIARFSRDQSGASNWRQWRIEFENGDVDHLIMNESGETWFRSYFESAESRRNWSNTINQHKQTVWLLRHHFDIFEWAKAGLAIDKTKTTEP